MNREKKVFIVENYRSRHYYSFHYMTEKWEKEKNFPTVVKQTHKIVLRIFIIFDGSYCANAVYELLDNKMQ